MRGFRELHRVESLADHMQGFRHHLYWLFLVLTGCRTDTAARVNPSAEWFEDVTDRSGLHYAPGAVQADPWFMPAMMAGGAAVLDFDNDGLLDIFLTPGGEQGAGSASKLYHQKAGGTFEDVTRAAGVEIFGYGQGVAVGDVNNDGWPDLFVTGFRSIWLFQNNGNSTFRDITQESGIDNPLWGTSAAFVDYDRDGWLDLVVVNYVQYNSSKTCSGNGGQRDFCGPSAFDASVSRLFRNCGHSGDGESRKVTFADVSVTAGLAGAAGPGLGAVCVDFDGDRWPDIFIANDGQPNHLWMNQKDGTFKEEAVLRGAAYNGMGVAEANMGVALGDINDDGLFDLFVTHLSDETHRLWLQIQRGHFQDRTAQVGLSGGGRSTGFGTLFADFDHDGFEDLVLANGYVKRPSEIPPASTAESFWTVYQERNSLYRNNGRGEFTNVSQANPAFSEPSGVHRVLVVADFDNDGAPDLLVTRLDGPARLYRNIVPQRGHWVMVRAIDPVLKRDAYGAELTVRASGRHWTRWMNPGYSFASSHDPRAHVGLGHADRVDEFHVIWPDGQEEHFAGTPADCVVTLRKGSGHSIAPPATVSSEFP